LGIFILLAMTAVFAAPAQVRENPAIRVDEAAMRFEYAPQAKIILPIVNLSGKELKGILRIEFLNESDEIAGSAQTEIKMSARDRLYDIVLDANALPTTRSSDLGRYRLRYEIAPAPGSEFAPVRGIVQFDKIVTDLFTMHVSFIEALQPGTKYPVRVRIVNPYNNHPLSGVTVATAVNLQGNGRGSIIRQTRTDKDGYALFAFDLLLAQQYYGGNIKITARKGLLTEEKEINVDRPPVPDFDVYLNTDKPIYQPGQTAHLRVLAFGSNHEAGGGAEVKVNISGPGDGFKSSMPTSQFGIASVDWKIPDDVKLGEYTIEASVGSERSDYWYNSGKARRKIRIGRYEIPDFAVAVTPNYSWFTKDRKASVRVEARYLSGEMLAEGRVRIVCDECITKESVVASGDLGADGSFAADIPLTKQFEDLDLSDYEEFEDISFTAYVEEVATRRTERRKFALRITRQPIHVYISPYPYLSSNGAIYVTAYYADGSPASADISIQALKPNQAGYWDDDDGPLEGIPLPLPTIRTNQYGVAKIPELQIPEIATEWGVSHLRLVARDADGLEGSDNRKLSMLGADYFRMGLYPRKTLHRVGEDIRIDIATTENCESVVIDIFRGMEQLQSKIVRLVNGKGTARFPYDPRFTGILTIQGYILPGGLVNTVGVVYPEPGLTVELQMKKTDYRPGEDAAIDFVLTDVQGKPVPGAVGAVVFDKAVAERERADFEGREFGFADFVPNFSADKRRYYYDDDEEQPSQFSLNELFRWSKGRDIPTDIDLLAEAVVNKRSDSANNRERLLFRPIALMGTHSYSSYAFEAIAHSLRELDQVLTASCEKAADCYVQRSQYEFPVRIMLSSYLNTGEYSPRSTEEAKLFLKRHGVDFDVLRDPWDNPYSLEISLGKNFNYSRSHELLLIRSSGPDEQWDTSDDLTAATYGWRNRIVEALFSAYRKTGDYPRNISELETILARNGIAGDQFRDPWGSPYKPVFSLVKGNQVLEILSAGRDREWDTDDDIPVDKMEWPFFAQNGTVLRRALYVHFDQTGDYLRDYAALRDELRREGVDSDSWRDPWGNRYSFDFEFKATGNSIRVTSGGPDGVVEQQQSNQSDDLSLFYTGIDYFRHETAALDKALAEHFAASGEFPTSTEQLQPILRTAGLSAEKLQDLWGQPYYFTFSDSDCGVPDIVYRLYTRYDYRGRYDRMKNRSILRMIAPKQEETYLCVMSQGNPDGSSKPFRVAEFSSIWTRRFIKELIPAEAADIPAFADGTGGIKGQIFNFSSPADSGFPKSKRPGVSVKAFAYGSGRVYETQADEVGNYLLRDLPPANYEVVFFQEDMDEKIISFVPVRVSHVTSLDAFLWLSRKTSGGDCSNCATASSGTITGYGSFLRVNYETAAAPAPDPRIGRKYEVEPLSPGFTPRVRQYFPETLYWNPEVATDAQGRGTFKFKLADNITTWRLSLAASTLDGRTAVAEKEFFAFLPFSVEPQLPRVLTKGDSISLPVVLRNYLEEPRTVSVEVEEVGSEARFSLTDAPHRKITVPAKGFATALVSLHAEAIGEGRLRVLTQDAQTGDAVELGATVRPDAQENFQTHGDLISRPTSFNVSIPPGALAGLTSGRLHIYPNVTSVLFESVAAMLREPYGCAEQTTSAGYANLVALRFLRGSGARDEDRERRALENIRQTVERLKAFRTRDGGIAYWTTERWRADVAVTAYALDFLLEASDFTSVASEDLSSLAAWLEGHRKEWLPDTGDAASPKFRMLSVAGVALRSLAAAQKRGLKVQPDVFEDAYWHLAAQPGAAYEAYMLANLIPAALDSTDDAAAEFLPDAVSRLLALGHAERGGLYWDDGGSSPFYGWGTAGRYEITGLAVSALAARRAHIAETEEPDAALNEALNEALDAAIRQGLVFLLRGRDRGYWYSTQATLRAMRAVTDAAAVFDGFGGSLEIGVRGRSVTTVDVSALSATTEPVIVDISEFLALGDNQVTLTPVAGMSTSMVLLSTTYWVPWEHARIPVHPELSLDVRFDKTEPRVGESIKCSVKVRRADGGVRGMMIASIGLPPGAEADRASLEATLGFFGVHQYEVLPDRILFYLWPDEWRLERQRPVEPKEVSFEFNLSVRMPMTAKSGVSVLYDYYNPEARTEVPPFRWIVK
jgi:hypothetical protein